MVKKRSILKPVVTTLLVIMIMLTVTPIPANATSSDVGTETIMGVVTTEELFVRNGPSINSTIIGRLYEGRMFMVEEVVTTDDTVYTDWLKINYSGEAGYVSKNYVNFMDASENGGTTNSETQVENYIGIITADGVHLRTEPTTNSDIVISLKYQSLINVIGTVQTFDSVWLEVNYNNTICYVSQEFVKVFKESSTDTSKQVGVVAQQVALRIRIEPYTGSDIIGHLLPGDCVDVLDSCITSGEYETWYQVSCSDGTNGWVAGQYLQVGKWTLVSTAMTQATPYENRNHNIALACSMISGELIIPEKQFSWFEVIGGACSAEKGFLEATIYQNGEISTGYGGGVCQVATTINMAVMDSGIETQAEQHSLPVAYVANRKYEATISYPWQNLTFYNTFEQPIMLELIPSSGCCMCNVYVLN